MLLQIKIKTSKLFGKIQYKAKIKNFRLDLKMTMIQIKMYFCKIIG